MKQRYIPALIMLVAGAVTSILDIIHKVELLESLKRLLLVLIIFYFIGLITKAIIKKATMPVVSSGKEEESSGQENAQENGQEAATDEKTGSVADKSK